jgi:hypothetical protein
MTFRPRIQDGPPRNNIKMRGERLKDLTHEQRREVVCRVTSNGSSSITQQGNTILLLKPAKVPLVCTSFHVLVRTCRPRGYLRKNTIYCFQNPRADKWCLCAVPKHRIATLCVDSLDKVMLLPQGDPTVTSRDSGQEALLVVFQITQLFLGYLSSDTPTT